MDDQLIVMGKWKLHTRSGNEFSAVYYHTADDVFAAMGRLLLTLDGEAWIKSPDGDVIMRITAKDWSDA